MGNNHDTWRGVAFGVGAGAAWGLVFLAPELASDFSPMQLSAARYLAYGLFAVILAHLAAALLHALIRRDGVFASMAPWRSRPAGTAAPPKRRSRSLESLIRSP